MRNFLLLTLLFISFNLFANNIEITICDDITGETVTHQLQLESVLAIAGTDDCASATVLSDGVLDSGDNTGLSEEVGEPIPAS